MGNILLVERLGNETIVNLALPSGTSWLALLDGDHNPALSKTISLWFIAGSALSSKRRARPDYRRMIG